MKNTTVLEHTAKIDMLIASESSRALNEDLTNKKSAFSLEWHILFVDFYRNFGAAYRLLEKVSLILN